MNPGPPPNLISPAFIFCNAGSLPKLKPAIPVSLVICISALPDFLSCISFAGASVVPTPIFKANAVDDAPTKVVFTSPMKVETPATLTLSKLVCPSTSISEFKSIAPAKVETPVIFK